MKIIDSAGWIEHVGQGPLAEAYDMHLREPGSLLTPTIILYEVHKFMLLTLGTDAALDVASMIMETRIVALTDGIARLAAQQSVDRKLPMADAIIYATALVHNATLVTSDAHFEGLPHVEYIPHNSRGTS